MFNTVPKAFMLIDILVCKWPFRFLSFFLPFLLSSLFLHFSFIFLFLTFLFSSYAFFSLISKYCKDMQLWFFGIIILEWSFL